MNFNLMDAAAAGTGFIQGGDQAQQLAIQRQQQAQQNQAAQMSLMMNGLKLQDEQRNAGFAREESDYARQLETDPDTMDQPMDKKMDLMANSALAHGDLVRANEMATNATNFRQAKINQDHTQQLTASKLMDSKQKLHNWMGSELAAAAEQGPEAFDQAKFLAQQSGEGDAQDQANLARLKWDYSDPDFGSKLARSLRLGSMTSRQAAATEAAEQRLRQQKERDDAMQRDREIKERLAKERLRMQQERNDALNKAGGLKPPNKNELDQADAYLKDSGLDPQGADFEQARQGLVSIKRQLKTLNPNLSDAQAYQQAAELNKQDLKTLTVPGMTKDTKKVTYNMQGATPQTAIPYDGNTDSLIPGRYYKTGSHDVVQFNGTGFVQVK